MLRYIVLALKPMFLTIFMGMEYAVIASALLNGDELPSAPLFIYNCAHYKSHCILLRYECC